VSSVSGVIMTCQMYYQSVFQVVMLIVDYNFVGVRRKERRSSMIKAEQGWDTHFAKKKTPPVARTFSGGLEKFDQMEDEALRSSQFESIPMPSHRTRTTDFSTAMGGRGELGTGRNWTGNSGAKGMKQSEREDAIRTSAIMQHLPREAHQVRSVHLLP
jgi:hypothetical protein